ncbi:MAG: LPS assembly lipoprotein LptE [Methylophilus sp.]|nr:LPS assembly lipoprotein LptE [Methylophilus sp.]
MMHWMRNLTLSICCAVLMACGFQLRGASEFTFKSIFVNGNTQITKALKKSLVANGVEVTTSPSAAEIEVDLMKEESEKRILSLSGDGVVNEFELYYRVTYRTKFANEPLWTQPQIMEARRDFSYSDANLLAKQSEEKQLNLNMQKDVMNSIIRRLSAIKQSP